MDNILIALVIVAMIATFLIVVGIAWPVESQSSGNFAVDSTINSTLQYRSRSMGKGQAMMPLMRAAIKESAKNNATNQKYLRWLKMADWYWGPNEPVPPNRAAPFWNLETLWGEKFIRAAIYGLVVFGAVGILGSLYGALFLNLPILVSLLVALALGGLIGVLGYSEPDSTVLSAAQVRQRDLSLEMGFRMAELRSEVLAGYTIQRAIRNIAQRPGGPFVEELRRVVAVLNATKDEGLAMDAFMDRNSGSEIVQEFANQIKMVSREGGEIAPALNVLTEAAQNRLRQQINTQGRKNLQDMSRPVGLASLFVTSLLIIVPVIVAITSTIFEF
jgi:Flp pilus assembly protein TadB